MNIGYQTDLLRDGSLSRIIIISVLNNLHNKIFIKIPEWNSNIELKLYYSTSGDERFLYDSSPNQLVLCKAETLYATIPRAVLDLSTLKIEENWLSNKRIRLIQVLHETINNVDQLNTYSIECNLAPIKTEMSLNVVANSNIETMLLGETILKTMYKFQKMYINYNGFRLPLVLTIPETYDATKPLDFGFSDRKEFKLDFNLQCDTFLPILFEETRLKASQRISNFTDNLAVR